MQLSENNKLSRVEINNIITPIWNTFSSNTKSFLVNVSKKYFIDNVLNKKYYDLNSCKIKWDLSKNIYLNCKIKFENNKKFRLLQFKK